MYYDSNFFPVFFLIFECGILIFSLLAMAFWVWMLVECVTKEPAEASDKNTWILVVALAGFIGAVIYFFAKRPERVRRERQNRTINPGNTGERTNGL